MAEKNRDSYVDCFKGVLILWVIHIHTVFWTGYVYLPEVVRQLTLLIDVPIFFFISGYVTRAASFRRISLRMAKQFARLYGNYLFISFLLLGILLLITMLSSRVALIEDVSYLTLIVKMTPYGGVWDYLRVYNGSLWFLRDYLSILVFLPFLLGISSIYKIKYNMLLFTLLFTALFPKEYKDIGFMFSSYGSISFFLFFFILGVIYREQEYNLDIKSIITSFAINLYLCLVILVFDNGTVNIQLYKFPPSIQYLILSLPLIHIFIILKLFCRQQSFIPNGKIGAFLRWCGVNIFYIYLFQGVICSIPYFFIDGLVKVMHPTFLYISLLAFNVMLTLLLTLFYVLSKNHVRAFFRTKASGELQR